MCSGFWAPGTENAFFTITRKLETASAPNMVARAKITPHGRTRVCSLWVLQRPNWAFSVRFPAADFDGQGSSGGKLSRVPTVPGFF